MPALLVYFRRAGSHGEQHERVFFGAQMMLKTGCDQQYFARAQGNAAVRDRKGYAAVDHLYN